MALKVGQAVVLTIDLTRYHQRLVVGARGVLLANVAQKPPWTGDSRYGHVWFEEAGPWDILLGELLPVNNDARGLDDEVLLAECQRRGLLKPLPTGSEAERLNAFIAERLGPDLWQDILGEFRKTTKH